MKQKLRTKLLEKLSQTSVSGSPPTFSITIISPNITQIFGTAAIPYINQLSQYLNQIIYYLSNGKYSLERMFRNISSIDTSSIIDQNLKKLIEFSKQVFYNIFNVKDNLVQHIENLEQSQHLNSLSEINPSGQLATKIPQGNIKTNIKKILQQIKQSSQDI